MTGEHVNESTLINPINKQIDYIANDNDMEIHSAITNKSATKVCIFKSYRYFTLFWYVFLYSTRKLANTQNK